MQALVCDRIPKAISGLFVVSGNFVFRPVIVFRGVLCFDAFACFSSSHVCWLYVGWLHLSNQFQVHF